MRFSARRTCAAVALVVALAGCSSTTSGSSRPLSDAARTQLQLDVLAVSRAIAAHNTAGARAALGDLQRDLAALEGAGAVSGDRAAQIQAVVAQLTAALRAATTTPPRTTAARTTSAAPKPAPVTTQPKPQPKPKPSPPPHHHKGGGHGAVNSGHRVG